MFDVLTSLQSLGFSANEAMCMQCSLRFGAMTPNAIAEMTKLPRTTVISILERLLGKGMYTKHTATKSTYYACQSIETILDLLKQQMRNQQSHVNEIEQNMHEFELMRSKYVTVPKVKYYEGHEVIELCRKDIVEKCLQYGEVYGVFDIDAAIKTTGYDVSFFVSTIQHDSVVSYEILPNTPHGKMYKKALSSKKHHIYLVDVDQFIGVGVDMLVVGDTIFQISYTEKVHCLEITNALYAQMQKEQLKFYINHIQK